nr:hypothetical protein [Zhihengliuella halotolerans]
MADRQHHASGFDRVDDAQRLRLSRRKRLLDEQVVPGARQRDGWIDVEPVGRRDDGSVGYLLGSQIVPRRELADRVPWQSGEQRIEPLAIRFNDGGDDRTVLDRAAGVPETAGSGSDNGKTHSALLSIVHFSAP